MQGDAMRSTLAPAPVRRLVYSALGTSQEL